MPGPPERSWRDPRLIAVFFEGYSSGLPLALTGATLTFWLATVGINKSTVGLFSLVGIAYAFKFVWSPVVDHLRLPVVSRLGRRRSWALLIQAALAATMLALGTSHPEENPARTAAIAVCLAFLSATQDIVIDAWRIELLRPEQQALGAAATQWGYRFGMLSSGAGALFAADAFGWRAAYSIMAGLMAIGFTTSLFSPDDAPFPEARGFAHAIREAVVAPFAEFTQRERWALVLIAVILYKFGDAMAGTMTSPLYVELGFSATEVASITKVFGVAASMAGIAAGGALTARIGVARALLWCGAATGLANLGYSFLAWAGHDLRAMYLSIGLENFAGGMGSAAFVTWLSALCSRKYTATQYALLSSLAAVGRTTLAAGGGYVATWLGWIPFFLFTTTMALPGLFLVWWLGAQISEVERARAAAR